MRLITPNIHRATVRRGSVAATRAGKKNATLIVQTLRQSFASIENATGWQSAGFQTSCQSSKLIGITRQLVSSRPRSDQHRSVNPDRATNSRRTWHQLSAPTSPSRISRSSVHPPLNGLILENSEPTVVDTRSSIGFVTYLSRATRRDTDDKGQTKSSNNCGFHSCRCFLPLSSSRGLEEDEDEEELTKPAGDLMELRGQFPMSGCVCAIATVGAGGTFDVDLVMDV